MGFSMGVSVYGVEVVFFFCGGVWFFSMGSSGGSFLWVFWWVGD